MRRSTIFRVVDSSKDKLAVFCIGCSSFRYCVDESECFVREIYGTDTGLISL